MKEYVVLKPNRRYSVGDKVMLDLEEGTTLLMKGIVGEINNTAKPKETKSKKD